MGVLEVLAGMEEMGKGFYLWTRKNVCSAVQGIAVSRLFQAMGRSFSIC
jgi:hypothetical protein